MAPEEPFTYFFLDVKFESNYRKEIQVAKILNILTGVAIFLCCLGLFGRLGYFDKSNRFWTKQTFKDSDSVRTKIIGYILKHHETGGSGSSYYESALAVYLHYKPLQLTYDLSY
jgi:hypothetical protein